MRSTALIKAKETTMRSTTLIKAAAVLAITLVLGTSPAWAQQQQVGVDGACAGTDVITSTVPNPLASRVIFIPNVNPPWHCVVNCYIQANNPFAGVSARGTLVLTNGGVPVQFTQRQFELTDNAGDDDEDFLEVSTGAFIPNLGAGAHTLACAARKILAGEPNFTVARSCIKIVCSDHRLSD